MRLWPVVFMMAACGPGTPTAKQPDPGPRPPDDVAVKPAPRPTPNMTSPTLRLPTGVKPTRNTVELTLDPASEDFTGTIVSELELAAQTDIVWLNADEITVDKATFTVDGQAIAAD